MFKSIGAEMKASYYALGRYDMSSVIEAPSDEAMAKSGVRYQQPWSSAGRDVKGVFRSRGVRVTHGLS